MKATLTALTVAATMFASSASAFDPDDLQKLKDKRSCWQCDLSDADLSSADLWGANLQGADLASANLQGAALEGAIMKDVILCNTIMPDGSVIYSGC